MRGPGRGAERLPGTGPRACDPGSGSTHRLGVATRPGRRVPICRGRGRPEWSCAAAAGVATVPAGFAGSADRGAWFARERGYSRVSPGSETRSSRTTAAGSRCAGCERGSRCRPGATWRRRPSRTPGVAVSRRESAAARAFGVPPRTRCRRRRSKTPCPPAPLRAPGGTQALPSAEVAGGIEIDARSAGLFGGVGGARPRPGPGLAGATAADPGAAAVLAAGCASLPTSRRGFDARIGDVPARVPRKLAGRPTVAWVGAGETDRDCGVCPGGSARRRGRADRRPGRGLRACAGPVSGRDAPRRVLRRPQRVRRTGLGGGGLRRAGVRQRPRMARGRRPERGRGRRRDRFASRSGEVASGRW